MQVANDSKSCPVCDYEFTSSGRGRMWMIVFLLVIILLAAFGSLLLKIF
jgi:hypothetical protein